MLDKSQVKCTLRLKANYTRNQALNQALMSDTLYVIWIRPYPSLQRIMECVIQYVYGIRILEFKPAPISLRLTI